MNKYILWYNNGFWRLFDSETFKEVQIFNTPEEAQKYIDSEN